MVVDVVSAHRVALGIALEVRRNRGLQIAHATGHIGDAIAEQVGQQGIELPEVHCRVLTGGIERHLYGRPTHALTEADSPSQGVAAHLHLAHQVHQRRVNRGRGRALHGVARLAGGVCTQQHQQAAIAQASGAHSARDGKLGAQVGNGHPDLAALVDHRAVDHKVAFQAGHTQDIELGQARDLQASTAVEGRAEIALQAQPRHTDQGGLTADRALPTAVGQQV